MSIKKQLLRAAAKTAGSHLLSNLRTPKKSTLERAGEWATDRMNLTSLAPRRRHSPSAGMIAVKGLGAAAVALPVGMWLGRRLFDRPDNG